MRVGLIDVDGHNFPNLALMKISAWHKACGDRVEWWWGDMFYYDIVYKAKVFSDSYSPDVPDPANVGSLVKGGTGYAIRLVDGKEIYDKSADRPLPREVEAMAPDYKELKVLEDDCVFQANMKLYGDEKIDKPGWLRWREDVIAERVSRNECSD